MKIALLKYPQDRADGHVALGDGKGGAFVTEIGSTPLRYTRACVELMRRAGINPFDCKD